MLMRPLILATALLACGAVQAGVYADDMSRCLVGATSEPEKKDLVRWMFVSMSVHPEVKGMANVPSAKMAEMDRKTAALFERLVTQACLKQSREALKYEGKAAFQQSFALLGQVAMMSFVADKGVATRFEAFTHYLNQDKLKALGADLQ